MPEDDEKNGSVLREMDCDPGILSKTNHHLRMERGMVSEKLSVQVFPGNVAQGQF